MKRVKVRGSRSVCCPGLRFKGVALDAGAAIQERSDAERHVLDANNAARESGKSWSAIGLFVGTSGEATRQRYGHEVG